MSSIPSAREASLAPSALDFFPTREVVDILGISRRQLQYWAKTDLVSPSATTPGGHRRYSFADLVTLKTTKRLIDAGVSVQRIRESIRALRERLAQLEVQLSGLVLVATSDIVLVFPADTDYEAVTGGEWVFEVGSFEREVRAWRLASNALPHRKARVVRRQGEATTRDRETLQTG